MYLLQERKEKNWGAERIFSLAIGRRNATTSAYVGRFTVKTTSFGKASEKGTAKIHRLSLFFKFILLFIFPWPCFLDQASAPRRNILAPSLSETSSEGAEDQPLVPAKNAKGKDVQKKGNIPVGGRRIRKKDSFEDHIQKEKPQAAHGGGLRRRRADSLDDVIVDVEEGHGHSAKGAGGSCE